MADQGSESSRKDRPSARQRDLGSRTCRRTRDERGPDAGRSQYTRRRSGDVFYQSLERAQNKMVASLGGDKSLRWTLANRSREALRAQAWVNRVQASIGEMEKVIASGAKRSEQCRRFARQSRASACGEGKRDANRHASGYRSRKGNRGRESCG